MFSKYNLPNASTSSINSKNNEMDNLSVQSYSTDLSSSSRSTKKSKNHSWKFGSSLSQDSAFGSMTDDELSIRTNSVQSIATFEDDGVGDSTTSLFGSPLLTMSSSEKAKQLDDIMAPSKTGLQKPIACLSTKFRTMQNKHTLDELEFSRLRSTFSYACLIDEYKPREAEAKSTTKNNISKTECSVINFQSIE